MSDSLSNKELINIGHQFAKAMSSSTPIIDIAKMLTRLAERLDVTTLALRETAKQRDALAAGNAELLDELECKQTFQQAFFRQSLMYDVVAEAYEEAKEQIAKDVEIKARLCLESNSLFDRLRAAEKQVADLKDAFRIALSAAGIDVATGSAKGE
ncbi:hypothetical protein HV346_13940 [Enterobacter sp. RHBSTW-00994]|uniref:hypothetical protein n=1 Tax=Enterobacter sp. RHBSTW-00994 TaxID=2742676 RepID=UPI0015EAAA4F|nr:hypothetical protein [Enterobacter sp. RHBSTW-00994]QLR43708.1 hypothetical protein HV346_13940 [Enterobacter sp. RHBSTW-00994]